MIYALLGRLWAAVGHLMAWEYRDTAKAVKRRDGPVNGLYGGFAFWPLSCPAGHGQKMPHEGRRTAHKRREAAGEYRNKGGHVGSPGGHKNPPRIAPRAGGGGIQDFFAVSQMTIKGRSRTNRIIKRCTSSQAPQGGPALRCTLLRMSIRQ